jgi:Ig-like domain-containing protein
MRKFLYPLIAGLTIVALQACNLPFLQQNSPAVQTEAALTVQAALTAAAPTASFTPVPFPTLPAATATSIATLPPAATATSSCDIASFVTDVTYPDGSSVNAGDSFTKTWRLKNAGTCSWTPSYTVVFKSGDAMGGPSAQALAGNVNPGQTVDISVNLTAPAANGSYTGNWGMRNASGVIFTGFYVQIVVGGGSGGPFAVTHVTYTYSTITNGSNHDCPDVTAHITTNGAGDVQYHFTRSDGATASTQTLHFGSASTQDVDEAWYLPTAAGSANRWIGIYVDSPNHQDFGHQSFTTTCSSP